MQKKPKKKIKKPVEKFDPYLLYLNSVQSPEHDAELLLKMWDKEIGRSRGPLVLQEDFCGTAALCYEWVQLNHEFQAVGIDLEPSALKWGKDHFEDHLIEDATDRVKLVCGDVLIDHGIKPNIICALNFSYFFIKQRSVLLEYFKTAKNSLAGSKDGLLIIDSFGGPEYLMPHEDRRRNSEMKFSYLWTIDSFDAVKHHLQCHISFQRDGESLRKNVFNYDWRLWSVPELTDLLIEAGFKTVSYWAEGLTTKGYGDGKFKPIKTEKNCQAWVIYLIAKV
ncbi:MAG: hypothetical protein NT027_05235 [Proteobacteria bacterium]|nr:hypothetical protein [Pseudomonadota bacterium]